MNVREAALVSLIRCENAKKYANIEVDSAIKKFGFKDVDRSLYTVLVYGVIEKKITLDYIIEQFSSKKIEDIDKNVLCILRLGIYQIMYLDRVPDSAACNESGELCKLYSNKGAVAFVNAVTRECSRQKDNIIYTNKEKDCAKYFSIYYSYPEWLCRMWIDNYGEEKTNAILDKFNQHPYLTLRVNTLKITRENLLSILEKDSIKSVPTFYSDFGINIREHISISELMGGLEDGLFYIQDEASQLCIKALDPQIDDIIIDVCACPGGKSFSCAIEMKNKGNIYSLDLHENKLSLVKNGGESLGINIINIMEQNGTHFNNIFENKADKVLCDVPCSGLGVIAKKPDIRNKAVEDITKLPEVQYKILQNSSKYVKEGGIIVYSTCTLNPAENEEVITKFLLENKNFVFEDFKLTDKLYSKKGVLTLFPDIHDTDGFFIAKLKKVANDGKD